MSLNFVWEHMQVFNRNLSRDLPVASHLLCRSSDLFPRIGLKHNTCVPDGVLTLSTGIANTVIRNTTSFLKVANQILHFWCILWIQTNANKLHHFIIYAIHHFQCMLMIVHNYKANEIDMHHWRKLLDVFYISSDA